MPTKTLTVSVSRSRNHEHDGTIAQSFLEVITTQLYWSLIEMSLCTIAACLPTLKPLFNFLPEEPLFSRIRSLLSTRSVDASTLELDKSSNATRNHDQASQHSEKPLV
jgi:hypothetical protein